MHQLARYLDPRRSLAAAIGWLLFALSIGLVLVATVWVGDIVRTNLLDQRGRQLDRMADRIAAELNLDLALRLQMVRALAAIMVTDLHDENKAALRKALRDLQQAYPEFEWIGVAGPQGRVLAATGGLLEGGSVAERPWFAQGLAAPSIGVAQQAPTAAHGPPATIDRAPGPFVELNAPVTGTKGEIVGVIGAQLSQRWLSDVAASLAHELRGSAGAESLVLDQDGTVLIGPVRLQGKHWESTVDSSDHAAPTELTHALPGTPEPSRGIERLADGARYLIARARPAASDALHALGWRVLVLEPLQEVNQAGKFLQGKIAAVLLGLGLFAAVLGVLLAHGVTRGLDAIARSADAIRVGAANEISVPPGQNEASRLGRALDELLTSLKRERGALQTLNAELDQRVAARTREIERLGEQTRYAAVVRERLKIARDLHDTLAHSMMAMLTEIRLLKRLAAIEPAALAEELTRAEEAAQQGLNEARAAIAQMRFNPVRDAGLAVALDDSVKLFVERTGIAVDYTSDAQAGTFADERAETLFRMTEEAMRNVELHAGATRVAITLEGSLDGRGLTLTIADNGVGFDASAAYPGHYGVAGLREQAQLIGAVLTIQSSPQHGTSIIVALTVAPGLDS